MTSTSPSRKRWMFWALLLTIALCAVAWFEDSGLSSDSPAADSRPRKARRPAPEDSSTSQAGAAVSSETRLAGALERLELPHTGKAATSASPGTESPETEEKQASPAIDLLAARSWYVPPPASKEAPKAPPLPFKVIGRIIEDESPVVFLSNKDRNLIVHVGEKLDNNYLVESIEKTQMTFIYLPLAERQVLTLGAVN